MKLLPTNPSDAEFWENARFGTRMRDQALFYVIAACGIFAVASAPATDFGLGIFHVAPGVGAAAALALIARYEFNAADHRKRAKRRASRSANVEQSELSRQREKRRLDKDSGGYRALNMHVILVADAPPGRGMQGSLQGENELHVYMDRLNPRQIVIIDEYFDKVDEAERVAAEAESYGSRKALRLMNVLDELAASAAIDLRVEHETREQLANTKADTTFRRLLGR